MFVFVWSEKKKKKKNFEEEEERKNTKSFFLCDIIFANRHSVFTIFVTKEKKNERTNVIERTNDIFF